MLRPHVFRQQDECQVAGGGRKCFAREASLNSFQTPTSTWHSWVKQQVHARIFGMVHSRNLIYNTCWEDPALDRIALELTPDDRVMVLTSAGCNALDYLLAGAGEVNAVDVNPIQNALLELKATAIEHLDHASFFSLFGQGGSERSAQIYHDGLRTHLSPIAQRYWDRHISFFAGKGWRKSFYYRGTSGFLARMVLLHAQVLRRLGKPIERLLEAKTVDEQREIYFREIRDRVWTRWLRWVLSRSLTLTLIGVPWPQRDQIVTQYPGGVSQFIMDALEAVVAKLPLQDNYFWRVYLQGHYTPECCPEYLKKANFELLKERLPRLKIHTGTVTGFLRKAEPGISKLVLLDHMDWMSCHAPRGLVEEWNAILERSRPGARVIFRSAGLQVHYLDHLQVRHQGRHQHLGDLLRYHPKLSGDLHQRDRVHTYGSFHIADLP